MPPPTITAREAIELAVEILATDGVAVEHLPIGFGNQNWRVSSGSETYILKIGPVDSADKWSSAAKAHELATAVGVPLPRPVSFARKDGRLVRMYQWVDGHTPAAMVDDPARVARLFGDLGSALAALHSIALDGFSSRLDGSAPSFRTWAEYVGYRIPQIRRRALGHDALDERTLDRASAAIAGLAHEVSNEVRPTLCHRDLHADNLLAGDDGRLLAIIDWDSAEAWDPAGEWFKLDWMLFPEFPGGAASFDAAYQAVHPPAPRWRERKRLVQLMETLNTVANAKIEQWNAEFEARARDRLQLLLARD